MASRRGASISLKMILTSTSLVLIIVALSGVVSALYTNRIFAESASRLSSVQAEAIARRGLAQMQTLSETARTALMQSDYSSLGAVLPEAAKKDPDIIGIYVVLDNGMVVAHSDGRLNERPVAEVDPLLGPRMAQISEPLSRIFEVPLPGGVRAAPSVPMTDRRFVFASPVLARGKKQGTVVMMYSLRGLDSELLRIEKDRVAARRSHTLRTLLLGLVFMLLGTAVAIWQGLRISRPIKLLAWRADQIAHGDLETRVEISSPDEIGRLAESFNYMADRLQVLLQETAHKATLEKELEVARTIQETLVPPGDLMERHVLRLCGHFQPATQCGGDWWTVHDLPDGRVLVAIGDVTGHGVPSAMITAAAKAACDVVRALDGARLTPARLLEIMNRAIYESAKRKFVMTCFCAVIDPSTRAISYSNAGHNFPYLYRAHPDTAQGESEFAVLMCRGNRLGDLPESAYAETSQTLRSGDVLIFYTDGIVECENPMGEEYGEKRFRSAIRNAYGLPPNEMRDAVVAAANSFYGDRPRKDDITMVVAQIK